MGSSDDVSEQFYNFPPFFTLQPTLSTRTRQFELWVKYLQAHCLRSTQFVLTRTEGVYTNNDIQRSLSAEFVTQLFDYMIKHDFASVVSQSKDSKLVESVIIWFTPKDTWFDRVYEYAKRNGLQNGGIATTFEILQDDAFKNMDNFILSTILNLMSTQTRKCELIGDCHDAEGVKFF